MFVFFDSWKCMKLTKTPQPLKIVLGHWTLPKQAVRFQTTSNCDKHLERIKFTPMRK